MTLELKSCLSFAQELATDIGKYIYSHQNQVQIVAYKDIQDIVTNVDLEAETQIIRAIRHNYPDHAITSEEMGSDHVKSDYRWIIDPLDGTKDFLHGLPFYNTSFALEYCDEPIVSVVYRPSTQEVYSAARGLGAYRNDCLIHISKVERLSEATIFSYLPSYKVATEVAKTAYDTYYRLSRKCYRLRGHHEEAASLCWLAQGCFEAVINLSPTPKWHDFIPGAFIAQETGARITNPSGQPLSRNLDGGFVVSNGLIHQELINIIGG